MGHFDDLGTHERILLKLMWRDIMVLKGASWIWRIPMTDAFEQRRTFGFDETRGISWLPLQVIVSGTLLHGISAVLFGTVECAYGSAVAQCTRCCWGGWKLGEARNWTGSVQEEADVGCDITLVDSRTLSGEVKRPCVVSTTSWGRTNEWRHCSTDFNVATRRTWTVTFRLYSKLKLFPDDP